MPLLATLDELDISDHLKMGRRLVAAVNEGPVAQILDSAQYPPMQYPPMERPDAFTRVLPTFLDNLQS